jgi:SAM-dependent methyltransferase
MGEDLPCRICGGTTVAAGSKRGILTAQTFLLRRCEECGFAFVANPYQDFARLYDERYYSGAGADPSVDYVFELDHPQSTIRKAEWRGILEAVASLRRIDSTTRWLDYGCGNGGLVRFLHHSGFSGAAGYETGWIADRARSHGLPLLSGSELASAAGKFDVVSAIEVLEHVVDPLDALRSMRRLLNAGGLLFLTTGNAAAHPHLVRWGYVQPEIHVSFFEPRTLERAMSLAGFRPERRGFLPGFDQIIRFRVLKRLGLRRERWLYDALPWAFISRVVDARLAITAHPIGWAV